MAVQMMTAKARIKIGTDVLMTLALLLLMAYSLIGTDWHEYIGIGMFVLVLVHHLLNGAWSKNILKGNYSRFRIVQLVVVMLLLLCMLGSVISGIIVSRHLFRWIPNRSGKALARTVHMLAANWGFVFMGVHLGLHRSSLQAQLVKKKMSRLLGVAATLVAVYGIVVFFKRNIIGYLLMQVPFAFFDFEEPLIWFFLDHLAAMILFVWIGNFLGKELKK
jgi:hypothetical protein